MKTVMPRSLNLLLIASLAASALSVAAGPVQAAAAVTVSTTADEFDTGGKCSLREAVYTVNQGASFGGCRWYGTATIYLPAGDYTLTIPNLPGSAAEDEAQTGDLDIRASLVLEGDGAKETRVTAGPDPADRIFHVKPYTGSSIEVTLRGITIEGGSTAEIYGGSGVLNDQVYANGRYYTSSLLLDEVIIIGNRSTHSSATGGGVNNMSRSTLTINHSTLSGNYAEFAGGGVYSSGPLSISDSTITGNIGVRAGDGVYSKALATITRTTISSIVSDEQSGSGEGIFKSGVEPLSITESDLVNNRIGIVNTGRINLATTTIQNNTAEGILNSGVLSVNGSLIAGNGKAGISNKTGSGSFMLFNTVVSLNNVVGIDNSSEATILASTVSDNLGNGILNTGELTLRGSLVAQNQGAGISSSDVLTVMNSTISANQGPGISSSGAALLQSLTITGNAGIGLLVLAEEGSSVTVQGSILARQAGPAANCAVQPGAALVSNGYNLLDSLDVTGREACLFNAEGDRQGDPMLTLEPGYYGGYTQTYAFTNTTPDNPAIDAIPAGHAACLPADQRMYSRPAEGNGTAPDGCDIGAYEEGGEQFIIFMPLLGK